MMDEQQRPANPYGAPRQNPQVPQVPVSPAPQYGVPQQPQPYGVQQPQPYGSPQQSFPGQLADIAKDATLTVARATADRVTHVAQNPQAVGAAVGKVGSTLGAVLLWTGIAVGVLFVLVGLTSLADSVLYGIGGTLIGLSVVAPCARSLVCRRRDRKAVAAWEQEQATNRELTSFLTEEDAAIARALAPTPRPAATPRNWKRVGVAAGVTVVVGIALLGAGADAYEEANPRTGVSQPGD